MVKNHFISGLSKEQKAHAEQNTTKNYSLIHYRFFA